jgi:general secretion pathway protein I
VTRRGEHGFTLIEALVAFVILALGLQAALHVFTSSRGQTDFSQAQRWATMLAQSTLDRVGSEIPLRAGTRRGEADGGFQWAVNIGEYVDSVDGRPVNIAAFDVTVTVSWGRATSRDEVTLRTLRLAPKG